MTVCRDSLELIQTNNNITAMKSKIIPNIQIMAIASLYNCVTFDD